MNLGDGLLFELENGKPKLILLSHGVKKNPLKLSCRHRAPNILSTRQLSCLEDLQGEERPAQPQAGRHRESKNKGGGPAIPFSSKTPTTGGRTTTLKSSETHEHHKDNKLVAKVKSDRHKHTTTVGALKANGESGQPQKSGTQAAGKVGLKDLLATGVTEGSVCLTSEQLQQILNTVQTTNNGLDPAEDHRTQGSVSDGNQTNSKFGSLFNDDQVEKMKEEERGGGGTDTHVSLQDKDKRLHGCLFNWLDERQSESRAAIDAKKAQWKRELDEQVALKQQQRRSLSGRLQAEEDADSVLSVRSSLSLREQPAAIRSSLRLGEITPMEELLSVERREEQKRRWLEELDKQREETSERRRREKLLQSQTEDHELWATHFDSLQRRPPVQSAAPSAPPLALSNCSDRGEWDPSSSLSLVWEAMSSCGAESVGGASMDTAGGHPTRASYLRTMTALLDPTQIEERERRRHKQLEQQRAIEAQVMERRLQREHEQARRREEEEKEERRVALEREMLERRYELDTQKERQEGQLSHQAELPDKDQDNEGQGETLEPSVTRPAEEEVSSSYKNAAVQTVPSLPFTADRVPTPHVPAQYQPPPPLSTAPPNSRSRSLRTGKENICLPGRSGAAAAGGGGGAGGVGGGDPYEAFARKERSRKDKRKPEWNTQRPSSQFVPASERYPAALQRNRQESRMKRQAELVALQERTCLSRTNPPPPLLQSESHLSSNLPKARTSPTRKVASVSRRHNSSAGIHTERGRSPPIPAIRHSLQGQQAASSSAPPPPVLQFIPYVRTDEVFNLDPLEPADTPPPHTHTAPQSSVAPPAPPHPLAPPEQLRNTHTQRQQEILRGLARLRQGLLQKQRELEMDLNPLLKHQNNELR